MADIEYRNSSLCLDKLDIDGNIVKTIQDPEGRTEIKTDSESKILSYRDSDGVLHEEAGIESDAVKANTLTVGQINITGLPESTNKTEVYLEKPKFAEFWFYGELPTDESDARIPTTLDFVYKVNGQILFSSKCTLAIQGHGSAGYPKKGYTFEPINADGDAIDLKWGDMIAVDSYHLKAYYTDCIHVRGIAGPRIWKKMIGQLPYPYNKINNKPLNISEGQKIDSYCIADAKYCEDGFNVAFYLNDEFYGLYTLKLKKNRKNYGQEKSNKSEIFLDCLGIIEVPDHSARLNDPFDYAIWELKNPKLKNYEEGGPITDATVLANIERLFYFTNNLSTEYANHADYIVLPHWICWYIFCELIGNIDVDGNNLELLTWDATHWSILPYDMDNTVGLIGASTIHTSQSGYLLDETFYNTFRNCYIDEIKQMYQELRNSKVITIDSLYKEYLDLASYIPRFVYDMDRKKWPDHVRPIGNGVPVLEQIYSYLESRLEYLDSVWLQNQ